MHARRLRVTHRALATTAVAGLVLTACLIGSYILYAQYGQGANSVPGFGALWLLWVLGLVVTGIALVRATVLALRMKQWGWAIALVFGTLALGLVTILTLPGLLILMFAIWGPPVAYGVLPSAREARLRWAVRICWLIVLCCILNFLLVAVLNPVLNPVLHTGAAALNGGTCYSRLAGVDACNFTLGYLGFLILGVPSVLALPIAWILALILALRLHQWAWLAGMVVPIVGAVVLFVTGAPLAGNYYANYQLGNQLLTFGWLLVLLALLMSLVYSLWPQPQSPVGNG